MSGLKREKTMSDIQVAIDYLRDKGIEAFEGSGILIIPCTDPDEIFDLACKARRYFKDIDFNKSWQVDPYYWEKKRPIHDAVIERQEFV